MAELQNENPCPCYHCEQNCSPLYIAYCDKWTAFAEKQIKEWTEECSEIREAHSEHIHSV